MSELIHYTGDHGNLVTLNQKHLEKPVEVNIEYCRITTDKIYKYITHVYLFKLTVTKSECLSD